MTVRTHTHTHTQYTSSSLHIHYEMNKRLEIKIINRSSLTWLCGVDVVFDDESR